VANDGFWIGTGGSLSLRMDGRGAGRTRDSEVRLRQAGQAVDRGAWMGPIM
jgi:hypothetical protein